MHRRTLFALAAGSVLASRANFALASETSSSDDDHRWDVSPGFDAALKRFLALPGIKSYAIRAGAGGSLGQVSHQPNTVLFTASAYKTFVLGQYLRDVERDRLSEDEQLAINDTVRSLGSPVFMDLAGRTAARVVLEAMIAHSDNTATDAATAKAGVEQVRALIAQAGLRSIRIPDSTRRFASYLVGSAPGVDLGWPGILEAFQNPPPSLRPPLNNVITMAGSARDFVSWYEQALAGAFFAKPETLTEFKRIQAMSVQIVETVPPNTPAYAKGGEVASLEGFNVKSFAGQMVVGSNIPVTFCFLTNWTGSADQFEAIQAEYFASIKVILGIIKQDLT